MKKAALFASGLGALTLVVGGCGSSGAASSAPGSGNTPGSADRSRSGQAGGPFGGPGGFRTPGASGLIAAISERTAQVQGRSAQTAVTWNARTTFSAERATTASAVRMGACVVAMPAGSGSPTGTATVRPTPASPVVAATVRIVDSGNCTGFRGRGRPGFTTRSAPGDAPSGVPGGFRGFGAGFGAGAVGKVTRTGANGFTVSSDFGGSTRPVTVTTTSATRYTETVPSGAAAVKVGQCMSAQGSTDSTGAVTASRVMVSAPVDGSCTGGFRGLQGQPRQSQGQSS